MVPGIGSNICCRLELYRIFIMCSFLHKKRDIFSEIKKKMEEILKKITIFTKSELKSHDQFCEKHSLTE